MTYKFKVGDKGKTREGRDYEVIAVDVKGLKYDRSVIAVVDEYPFACHSNGSEYGVDKNISSSYDLMPPDPVIDNSVFVRLFNPKSRPCDIVGMAHSSMRTVQTNQIGTIEIQFMSYGDPKLIYHPVKEK